MSITSAKSGATGISLALDNNFMEPIASTLVGSGGVNQITFNDIPQTYKHLQVRAISRTGRSAGNDPLYIRFNSDSGTNYAWHAVEGNGTTVTAYGYASQAQGWIYIGADSVSPSNVFGAHITDILDYTNTNKLKTVRNLGGVDNNGSGVVGFNGDLWQSTNAITSINFTTLSGTSFAQYSRFSLYGIKG